MNSDRQENYGQDDKNFQNADPGNQGLQKASSPAGHPISENAEPDYGDDLSVEQTSRESGQKNPSVQGQQEGKVPNSGSQNSDKNSNPFDSENLDQESDSASKDITEQDIEEDLKHNDPSEGFETDIDTTGRDEAESEAFETIQPDQDNPVHKEFEIGQLGNEALREDELTRDETGNGATRNYKPSQRKF